MFGVKGPPLPPRDLAHRTTAARVVHLSAGSWPISAPMGASFAPPHLDGVCWPQERRDARDDVVTRCLAERQR